MSMKFSKQTTVCLLIGVLLVLGLIFRFVHLGQKVFWVDEIFTLLRISGHNGEEVKALLRTAQELSFVDLQRFLAPDRDKSMVEVIHTLMAEDAHLPVFYFFLARLWAETFGGSVIAVRGFSAILGIFCLPAMYWLSWELFRSRLIAWLSLGIIAISPMQVLNSQLARFYSLWTLMVLISSALLLRSQRKSIGLNWSLYAISAMIGLYSHLLFGLTLLGHGIYVSILERFRFTQRLRNYLLASIFASSALLPWLFNLVLRSRQSATMMSSVLSERFSLPSLAGMWCGNVSRLFFDIGLGSSDSFRAILPFLPVMLAFAGLGVYSVYFLCRSTNAFVKLFILTLTLVPFCIYLISDLLFGGRLSGLPRYSVPIFIGIQLSIAYIFAIKLFPQVQFAQTGSAQASAQLIPGNLPLYPLAHQTQSEDRQPQRSRQTAFQTRCWSILVMAVFSCNVISCALSSPAVVWWHTDPKHARYIPEMTAWINQFAHPLVLVGKNLDNGLLDLAMIGYPLKPEARLWLLKTTEIPDIPKKYDGVFVYYPSEGLQQKLKARGTLQPLSQSNGVFYRFQSRN